MTSRDAALELQDCAEQIRHLMHDVVWALQERDLIAADEATRQLRDCQDQARRVLDWLAVHGLQEIDNYYRQGPHAA